MKAESPWKGSLKLFSFFFASGKLASLVLFDVWRWERCEIRRDSGDLMRVALDDVQQVKAVWIASF